MPTTAQATGVHRPDLAAPPPDAHPRESTPGAGAAARAPRSGALDLHKGIAEAGASGGCPRWPAGLRLESTLGDLIPGRCKATNLCDYCARLAAVENAEVLAQDALHNSAPEVWTVTTTRSTVANLRAYRLGREAIARDVKRCWRGAERATMIEFTTGMGTRSEGKRRPHWNDMWKGVPADAADELRDVVAGAWCSRVDAEPDGQYSGAIAEVGGLMRYLALHFQKESQQPPKGWRGHRFSTSRGYLAEPMDAARERARDALRLRRELWKVERRVVVDQWGEEVPLAAILDAEQLWDLAEAAHGQARELAWSLVRLQAIPTAFGEGGEPSAWTTVALPVRRP